MKVTSGMVEEVSYHFYVRYRMTSYTGFPTLCVSRNAIASRISGVSSNAGKLDTVDMV